MLLDIEGILAAVELPTESVTLCLKGSLVAEYERLDAQLRDQPAPTSLADANPTSVIVEQMNALREQMLDHEVEFRFQALPAREGSDYYTTEPDRETLGEGYVDAYHEWICELIARTCAEPKLAGEQADLLSQKLSNSQWLRLGTAAMRVNYGERGVPFSRAASVLSRAFGENSKRPPELASPGPSSLADPSPSEPTTSTATTDG